MEAFKRQFIEENAPEWSVSQDGMLICPCGERVEDDGQCPEGHVSPIKRAGLI